MQHVCFTKQVFKSKQMISKILPKVLGTVFTRYSWWNSLSSEEKDSLTSIFDRTWFEKELDQDAQVAYAYTAQQVYDFLESGADSDATDAYIGFAPLLLRASFHSSGTYTYRTGTGGTNGGTIFNHAELADEGNGCIATATKELFSLFHGSALVPLADTTVIAGVVALDVMNVSPTTQDHAPKVKEMIQGYLTIMFTILFLYAPSSLEWIWWLSLEDEQP